MWVNGGTGRTTCSAFLRPFHSGTSVDGAAQGASSQSLGSASSIGEPTFTSRLQESGVFSLPVLISLPARLHLSPPDQLAQTNDDIWPVEVLRPTLSGSSPFVSGILHELSRLKSLFSP